MKHGIRNFTSLVFSGLLFMFFAGTSFAEEAYPLREKFPNVPFITTQELTEQFGNIIVIDVRSKFENDVIKINNGLFLPMSKSTFIADLEKVVPKDSAKKVAFYCNGHTCAKSYEAVDQALQAGFKNVYVYDAGPFEWLMVNPDKTTLLGETPAKKDQIISKEAFHARLLSYDEFLAKASAPNAVVIDIRDAAQRIKTPNFPGIKNIPLDRMADLLKQGQFKTNDLLIFDAVGKQVNWLQYHLESNGYTKYNFLEKGVLSMPE